MIISRLEEYDYAGAAIAVVMLALSFAILFLINLLQAWASRRTGELHNGFVTIAMPWHSSYKPRCNLREPTWVRYTLITVAMIFFLSCLILPLILVFL